MREEGAAPAVGGFFALELPPAGHEGLDALWGLEAALCLRNARSALAALLDALQPQRVWLPAYLCADLTEAVAPACLRYYPVGERLAPDVERIDAQAGAGDVVLVIDYFGRPPAADLIALAAARRDLVFVEDRAQALDTGCAPWADWCLYSPRKLCGVADGGILQPCRGQPLPSIAALPADDVDDRIPALLRFEDEAAHLQAVWHAANQAREQRQGVSRALMSRLSRHLLGLLPARRMAARRRENHAFLAARLPHLAWLGTGALSFAPLGFPVRLAEGERDRVWQGLIARRIYAARHWAELPSPRDRFPDEHALASSLLTLPCDHRYGPADMERIADAMVELLA